MRKETSTNFENEQMIVESCAMAFTISLIGGRWKPTILWQLLDSPKRYTQLKEIIPHVTPRMLTLSLKELENDKLIQKRTYKGFPPKVEYRLTERGRSMQFVLKSMSDWGKRNKQL